MRNVNRFGIFGITRTAFLLGFALGAALSSAPVRGAGNADSEVLFLYPPDGWRLGFETDVGGMRYREFVPPGDSPARWMEKITVQAIPANDGLSPSGLAVNLRNRFAALCGRVSFRGPERFNLDGYLAVRFYAECSDPSPEGRPEGAQYHKHLVAAFQIIQGRRKVHVIERAWQGPARTGGSAPYGRGDLWGWDAFWHHVEICDFADTARACFGLGLLSADKADVFVSRIDAALPYECGYFRVLSVLPDAGRPIKPTMVVPLKLGPGRFGGRKHDLTVLSNIGAAYRENRPVAVIVTMARRALSGIFRTDTAKAARDAAALAGMLVKNGVDGHRLRQRINTDCPGG